MMEEESDRQVELRREKGVFIVFRKCPRNLVEITEM